MGIFKGTAALPIIYRGDTLIEKVYRGDMLIYGYSPIPHDYILRYDLNGDLTDQSGNANHGVAGTYSLPSYSAGRKSGSECAVFNVLAAFKTTSAITLGTKVSVSMWINTTQTTAAGIVCELSPNANNNSAFFMAVSDNLSQGNLSVRDNSGTGLNNYRMSSVSIADDTWKHVAVVIDRTENAEGNTKIYLNGVLDSSVLSPTDNADINTVFGQFELFFGARNAAIFGTAASMQDIRIYDRALSAAEIWLLYNE